MSMDCAKTPDVSPQTNMANTLDETEGQPEDQETKKKCKRKSPLILRAPLPAEEESQWSANVVLQQIPLVRKPTTPRRIRPKKTPIMKSMNLPATAPPLAPAEDDDGVPFSLSQRLKAIERVKLGENSEEVAKSLGIPGHKLRQWIYQLAITDWNNGSKAGRIENDLLDRALYTWFVQKIQHGAVVSRSCLVDQAKTFALRLYGTMDIVSDSWLAKWQARHKIEVPDLMKSLPGLLDGTVSSLRLNGEVDVVVLDKEAAAARKKMRLTAGENDDNIVYTTDFDVLTAIENTLKTKHLLKFTKHLESFLSLIETNGKIVDKMYDTAEKKISMWHKMLARGEVDVDGMLQEIGKQNGVVNNGRLHGKSPTAAGQMGDVNDIIHVGQISLERPNLPPIGQVHRKKLTVGMKVYAMKVNSLGVWYKARIMSIKTPASPGGEVQYKIKFESKRMFPNRRLLAKHLAYTETPSVILPVGSRVIAYYKDEYGEIGNALYAGTIAEPPKKINSHRYLVFFDDGYAQYVKHTEVYLVCEASKNVWEDIHPESRDFIKAYLQQYPERPMVKLQAGQVVKTEWMGQWWSTKVVKVDASLAKMFFEADKRTEWMYRGSTRLAPLFHELTSAEESRRAGKMRRHNLVAKRKHQPYVEYTMGLDDPAGLNEEAKSNQPQLARKHFLPSDSQKNVARKSTTQLNVYSARSTNNLFSRGQLDSNSGTTELHRLSVFRRQVYVPHACGPNCAKMAPEPVHDRDQNPLRTPMLCGWQREIVKHRNLRKHVVFYRSPCGRRLRSLPELTDHLFATDSLLTVDLFCFDSYVHAFSEFKPTKILTYLKDITYGKESMRVCCVNSLSDTCPPPMEYSASRYPANGVVLNLDPEFLCGCDCEDDCRDTSKCQCCQLTVSATEAMPSGRNPGVGYKYRRLMEPLTTGIYECNSRCKCRKTCLNRVAQNGIKVRLQLFKTELKGWGIRCLDDLPQGMFICNYAGQLQNEEGAIQDGTTFGDEYQAELDHIEVVERYKEGYESDVADDNNEEVKNDNSNLQAAGDSAEDSESDSADSPYSVPAARDSDFNVHVNEMDVGSQYSTRSKGKRQEKDLVEGQVELADVPDRSVDDLGESFDEPPCNFSMNACELSPKTLEHLEGVKDHYKVMKRPHLRKQSHSKDNKESRSESLMGEGTEGSSSRLGLPVDPFKSNASPTVSKEKFVSLRRYFNEEFCYIMDAKNCGNIGRYLNHSCSPNVFVQNVFVDSHDLRFPWVAFFAATFIRAGTELTWDYNYEVGSVPNKRLFCYCESTECRGRLL